MGLLAGLGIAYPAASLRGFFGLHGELRACGRDPEKQWVGDALSGC